MRPTSSTIARSQELASSPHVAVDVGGRDGRPRAGRPRRDRRAVLVDDPGRARRAHDVLAGAEADGDHRGLDRGERCEPDRRDRQHRGRPEQQALEAAQARDLPPRLDGGGVVGGDDQVAVEVGDVRGLRAPRGSARSAGSARRRAARTGASARAARAAARRRTTPARAAAGSCRRRRGGPRPVRPTPRAATASSPRPRPRPSAPRSCRAHRPGSGARSGRPGCTRARSAARRSARGPARARAPSSASPRRAPAPPPRPPSPPPPPSPLTGRP